MAKSIVLFCLVHFVTVGILLWTLQFVLPLGICHYYNLLAHCLLGGIIAYELFPLIKRIFFDKKLPTDKKSVLITGCDRGFGFDIAKRLDSQGYHVFASCLFPTGEGAQNLKQSCSDRLHVLGLDVTKDESVKEALNYVKENLNDTELWAVVNNAGIAKGFGIEWTPIKSFQDVFDVNTIGVVRVTKAFLPLLRYSKGRVVTITSIGGRIAVPNYDPYFMSKFATTCFCECLRQEMYRWGVKVIAIEPELFRTPLLDTYINSEKMIREIEHIDKEVREDYGEQFFITHMKSSKRSANVEASDKSYKVIDAVEGAITFEEPSDVYKPRHDILTRCMYELMEHLPQPLNDILIRLRTLVLEFGLI